MTKITFLVGMVLMNVAVAQSQIKVGNNNSVPSNSSILEVESTNRGFLPPRISLSSNTMFLNGVMPTNGMVIFNTNSTSIPVGLCVWNGGRWNKLVDSGNQGVLTSYVLLKQTVRQALANGTRGIIWNEITSSQSPPGDNAMWTNGANITIRRSGIYCISANVGANQLYEYGKPFAERHAFISKNGMQVAGSGYYAANDPYFQVFVSLYCSVGDVIQIGYTNGGATMESVPYATYCAVAQIPATTSE